MFGWLIVLFYSVSTLFGSFQRWIKLQTIQFSINIVFVHTQLNVQTILFETDQFWISTEFQYQKQFYFKQFTVAEEHIDRTLSGAPTLDQSWPGRDGNEGILHIPLISSITQTSPSDCLLSISRTVVGRVLPLYREAVGVFYSPSRLGKTWFCLVSLLNGISNFISYFIPKLTL